MGQRITGFHAIEEAVKNAPAGSVLYLCRNSEKRNDRLEGLAKANGKISIRKIAKIEMDRMVPNIDHRGCELELGESKKERQGLFKTTTIKDFLKDLPNDKDALILVLDGITDVQNLGAILRSADQFAVDLVIVPDRRSASVNPTVARISSGASQYVPIAQVVNIVRELALLQEHGFWVYGADMDGDCLPSVIFPKRTVLIMGSEGDGMSQLVKRTCDHIVAIPTEGHIDSLNVSVATGICLYEIRRQQAQRTV